MYGVFYSINMGLIYHKVTKIATRSTFESNLLINFVNAELVKALFIICGVIPSYCSVRLGLVKATPQLLSASRTTLVFK